MEIKRKRPGFFEGLFTRQERMALLFIAGVSLLGMGILSWRGAVPRMNPPIVEPLRLQVRVNSAGITELTALPGIGPVLARRILEDRKLHGRFLTLTDLKRVKGINKKALDRMRTSVQFD